jgi:hypothetical protein
LTILDRQSILTIGASIRSPAWCWECRVAVLRRSRARTAAVSAVGALVAAGGSVVAGLCCVGPGVYGVVGAGGVLAAARFAPWRPYLLGACVVLLVIGFWAVYRLGGGVARCPSRGRRPLQVILWVAAALAVAAALLPEVLA